MKILLITNVVSSRLFRGYVRKNKACFCIVINEPDQRLRIMLNMTLTGDHINTPENIKSLSIYADYGILKLIENYFGFYVRIENKN